MRPVRHVPLRLKHRQECLCYYASEYLSDSLCSLFPFCENNGFILYILNIHVNSVETYSMFRYDGIYLPFCGISPLVFPRSQAGKFINSGAVSRVFLCDMNDGDPWDPQFFTSLELEFQFMSLIFSIVHHGHVFAVGPDLDGFVGILCLND